MHILLGEVPDNSPLVVLLGLHLLPGRSRLTGNRSATHGVVHTVSWPYEVSIFGIVAARNSSMGRTTATAQLPINGEEREGAHIPLMAAGG